MGCLRFGAAQLFGDELLVEVLLTQTWQDPSRFWLDTKSKRLLGQAVNLASLPHHLSSQGCNASTQLPARTARPWLPTNPFKPTKCGLISIILPFKDGTLNHKFDKDFKSESKSPEWLQKIYTKQSRDLQCVHPPILSQPPLPNPWAWLVLVLWSNQFASGQGFFSDESLMSFRSKHHATRNLDTAWIYPDFHLIFFDSAWHVGHDMSDMSYGLTLVDGISIIPTLL